MSLIDDLVQIADQKPLPGSPRLIKLPEADAVEPEAHNDRYTAEGQSFVIEYEDAIGQHSTRRITVNGLRVSHEAGVTLSAYCHERKAPRFFSVDGIHCCIDFDGVVYDDVPVFLTGVFGADIFSWTEKASQRRERWIDFIDFVRHDAVLLAAISGSDGQVRMEETDAGLDHMLWTLEMNGRFPEQDEVVLLARYLHRLRPSRNALDRAVRELPGLGARRVERILRACVGVMDADGMRKEKEIKAINAIAVEVIGVPLV